MFCPMGRGQVFHQMSVHAQEVRHGDHQGAAGTQEAKVLGEDRAGVVEVLDEAEREGHVERARRKGRGEEVFTNDPALDAGQRKVRLEQAASDEGEIRSHRGVLELSFEVGKNPGAARSEF